MIRVLHVFYMLNNAGTERVISNLYKNIDREKVQFDFLVNKKGNNEELFKELGANIYYIDSNSKKEYYNKCLDFLKSHKYSIVHVHMSGNMYEALRAAKKSKVKCRIIHSHNARLDLPPIAKLYKILKELSIDRNATDYFACSKLAAKWLFPLKYKKTKIVYNGIDIKEYQYDEKIRKEIREKFNINAEQRIVINTARLEKQKNQNKIINIADKMKQVDNNVKFFIVGNGKLEKELKQTVKDKKLEETVIFLGNRNDVNKLLMASDLFLFTSIYEGLGISLVEAQVSNLQTLSSNRIPEEANIGNDTLHTLPLEESDETWCDKIIELLNKSVDRRRENAYLFNTYYNIQKVAKEIEEFYLDKGDLDEKNWNNNDNRRK